MKPPYSITNSILDLYGQIKELLGTSKSLYLVKPEARLRKENRIQTIHSSLAIEGNTLNLQHVSALIDHHKVIGPEKDILEVKNAIEVYDRLNEFTPYNLNDFLKAHKIMMKGLVKSPGKLRRTQVGILKGEEVSHIAPGFDMVPGLMNDLFGYVKNDSDLEIIKSCVFHYEMEFIHPFEDGNGRMGRYWQTRILMNVNPIFEFVPIEKLIKENQKEYYKVLEISDKNGESTTFIEFMLNAINQTLKETIDKTKSINKNYTKRVEQAINELNGWFDRKRYMEMCKDISSATASRDLKQMVADKIIESSGTGRITRYRILSKKK